MDDGDFWYWGEGRLVFRILEVFTVSDSHRLLGPVGCCEQQEGEGSMTRSEMDLLRFMERSHHYPGTMPSSH